MKINVEMKMNRSNYTFMIEENNDLEALHKAIVLSSPRMKCDACGNYDPTKFKFASNKDSEGHVYVNVVCKECGANSKLGKYRTGGYFWHNFEQYKRKDFAKKKPDENANDFFKDIEKG